MTTEKRPGRPRLGIRRQIIVGEEQWAHWQRAAEERGENVSEMVRRLMDLATGYIQDDRP